MLICYCPRDVASIYLIEEWFLHLVLITSSHLFFKLWGKIKSGLINVLVKDFLKPVYFTIFSFSIRHPQHAYFNPNDFLEVIQHDIEREELEYEVNIIFLLPPLNEDLHPDSRASLLHEQSQGRLSVSSPMALLATSPHASELLMGHSLSACRPDRNRVAGLFQQMHNGDIITY